MKKNVKIGKNETGNDQAVIIASRKSCKADGTGLSHYILVDKKAK